MLNSGKKILDLHDKKNKYSNSRVVRKIFYERSKKPYPPPPPLQVKWSVPKYRWGIFIGLSSELSIPNAFIASSPCNVIYIQDRHC